MEAIDFKFRNRTFIAPPDVTQADIRELPAYSGEDENGYPNIVSCWKMTSEELKTINENGGIIYLGVMGNSMPPVWITPDDPFSGMEIQTKEEETNHG